MLYHVKEASNFKVKYEDWQFVRFLFLAIKIENNKYALNIANLFESSQISTFIRKLE